MRTKFYYTVSAVALTSHAAVGALAIVALSTTDASAGCTFIGSGPGVGVSCSDAFDQDLEYDRTTDTLYIVNDPDDNPISFVDSRSTDLTGDNDITVQASATTRTLGLETDPFTNNDRYIDLGPGDDSVNVTDLDELFGTVVGGPGNDSFTLVRSQTFQSTGATSPVYDEIGFVGGPGDDTVFIDEESRTFRLEGNDGDDTFHIFGGAGVPRNTAFAPGLNPDPVGVSMGDGNDILLVGADGGISGNVETGAGNDSVTINGRIIAGTQLAAAVGDVSLGSGDDEFILGGDGLVEGSVILGSGDDTATVGGTIGGGLFGGTGTDTVTITGGSIARRIDSIENLTFDGSEGSGTFDGQFVIYEPDTGPSDIVIRNATFTNPVGGVSNLALEGAFNSLDITNSTIALFGDASIPLTIDAVNFSGGNVALAGDFIVRNGAGGFGNVTASGTVFNMVNGRATDTFEVGNLSAGNTTVAFDVNPIANTADGIIVNGVFNPDYGTAPGAGNNLLRVAFTSDPVGTGEQTVQLVSIGDETLADATPTNDGTFVVETFSRAVIANFEVLEAPNGSTFLRYDGTGTPADPSPEMQDAFAVNGGNAVNDVLDGLLNNATGFAAAPAVAQVTPTFGIFSSGQAGRLWHDGFDVSVGNTDIGSSQSFTADNFSAIVTGELDASAEFGLEDIGVRISAFGGYASSDVDLSSTLGNGTTVLIPGGGINRSGVAGGAVLLSKVAGQGHLNYGVLSTAGFFGGSDVTIAGNTVATGSYDTTGWILAGKAGRNMAVADRVRLDLRVGASFNLFSGNSFTASDGRRFGGSQVRYGTVSFEPGVSTAFQTGDAVVSPFARLVVGTRLGYENSADIGGNSFDFEDGDLFGGAQFGANVRLTDRLAAGALIEGRLTEDSQSLAGKLSLKYTIPRS